MAKIRIKNWEKFQHYKHRNPPWIKLHKELLTSQTWVMLSDASRVLAIAMMLLAGGNNNEFNDSEEQKRYIRRVAYLDSVPDFKPLLDCDFLEYVPKDASNMLADDSGENSSNIKPSEYLNSHSDEKSINDASALLASCKPMRTNADPETETETETEKKNIQTTDVVCSATPNDKKESEKEKSNIPYQRVFELYHEILPMGLRAKKLNNKRKIAIRARWNESKLHQNEQFWVTFFNQVANSPFLAGKIYDPKRGPFILTLDKILRPDMFTQIIDGYYNRDNSGRPTENLFD